MPSETEVINVALHRVGATRITSRTDGTKSANVADDLYDELRDDLLRSHPWNFATLRVKLAQVSTDPVFEFDHQYALPSDWLRTVSVHNNDAGHGTILFRSELFGVQKVIVASVDEVFLRYVHRVTDPNLMVPDFRMAFEYALARDFSIPLASSNSLYDRMEAKARSKLAQARSTDALGAFPELRPRGSWANSRGGRELRDFLSD